MPLVSLDSSDLNASRLTFRTLENSEWTDYIVQHYFVAKVAPPLWLAWAGKAAQLARKPPRPG
jgi:hypothetical protein